jgi:hypothetical protein
MSGTVVNAKKVEDSNQKRLESMREKLDQFKKQKSMVRASLNDLDSKVKKIVFESESESDDASKQVNNGAKKTKLDFNSNKVSSSSKSSSKKKLLSSDSDSSDSDSDDEKVSKNKAKSTKTNKEEEDTIKMFESKINLDDKKANKVNFLDFIMKKFVKKFVLIDL